MRTIRNEKMIRSKKTLKIILVMAVFFFHSTWAYASDSTVKKNGRFHIRQEVKSDNGVLVSRPQATDMKISDIIYLNKIYSMEDYSQWLAENVHYERDQVWDIWQKPLETLRKQFGDCEDYALLTSAVARIFGYNPRFIICSRPDDSHAICIYQQGDYFVWFDNARIIKTAAKTFEEFAQKISEEFNYDRLVELDMQTYDLSTVYQTVEEGESEV